MPQWNASIRLKSVPVSLRPRCHLGEELMGAIIGGVFRTEFSFWTEIREKTCRNWGKSFYEEKEWPVELSSLVCWYIFHYSSKVPSSTQLTSWCPGSAVTLGCGNSQLHFSSGDKNQSKTALCWWQHECTHWKLHLMFINIRDDRNVVTSAFSDFYFFLMKCS